MAGRPKVPDHEKKVREAIYFEPHILKWLREKAQEQKCTVSVVVNRLSEDEMNRQE